MKKREWLKEKRDEKNLSQKEIADLCGMTQQMYNYIENGKKRPSPELAKRIGKTLGIDWTKFYE